MNNERKIKIMSKLIGVLSENNCSHSELSELSRDLFYVARNVMRIPNTDYVGVVGEYYKNRAEYLNNRQD